MSLSLSVIHNEQLSDYTSEDPRLDLKVVARELKLLPVCATSAAMSSSPRLDWHALPHLEAFAASSMRDMDPHCPTGISVGLSSSWHDR